MSPARAAEGPTGFSWFCQIPNTRTVYTDLLRRSG